MASELELKLTWENGVSFGLTSKEDADPVKTIISVEENGHLPALWTHVAAVCQDYFSAKLGIIGEEMKAP